MKRERQYQDLTTFFRGCFDTYCLMNNKAEVFASAFINIIRLAVVPHEREGIIIASRYKLLQLMWLCEKGTIS